MKFVLTVLFYLMSSYWAPAETLTCNQCHARKGTPSENDCKSPSKMETCSSDEDYCANMKRYTREGEELDTIMGCLSNCINKCEDDPDTQRKKRCYVCCKGNLCNTDANTTSVSAQSTKQASAQLASQASSNVGANTAPTASTSINRNCNAGRRPTKRVPTITLQGNANVHGITPTFKASATRSEFAHLILIIFFVIQALIICTEVESRSHGILGHG